MPGAAARQLRWAAAIVCLACCAACAQVAMMSVPPIIDALVLHLDQGSAREVVELERKNDWPGMLSMAHAQLQREPGRSDWWFLQGYALSRQGRHAAAIESYREAIRLSPEEEGSWLALGVSQSELGQHEAAITTYRQALRYRPGSARAYLALADVYLGQGRADLAIPNYRESVRYDRESAQGWYGLAASYLSTGQRVRAEEAMSELRELDAAAADRIEKRFSSQEMSH